MDYNSDNLGLAVQGIFALVNFIWFFVINNRFCKLNPSYDGRYLWSLFFFQQFFILISIFNSLIWIAWSIAGLMPKTAGMTSGILGILCSIGMFYFFEKLRNVIFNWNNRSIEDGNRFVTGIIMLVVTVQIINAVLTYITIKYLFNLIYELLGDWVTVISWIIGDFTAGTFFDSTVAMVMIFTVLIFQLLLDWLVYNASSKKLYALDYEFNTRNSFRFSTIVPPPIPKNYCVSGVNPVQPNSSRYDTPVLNNGKSNREVITSNEGYENLKEIKHLLDRGIITEEEFKKMKKDILSKGI